LRVQDETWAASFERTPFSTHTTSLINNMNIDLECHDAKVSYSEMLRSGTIGQSNSDVPTELITSESNELLSTFADDLAIAMGDDARDGVFDDNDNGEYARQSSTLTENELHIHNLAMKIVSETVMPNATCLKRCATAINTRNHDDLQLQRQTMNQQRLLKRPHAHPEEVLTNKHRRTDTNPGVSVEQVLDNLTFMEIEFKQLSLEQRTIIVDEIHHTFRLHQNAEQSRAFRIAAEHFMTNDLHQMLMFVTGMGSSGKSHVIKTIVELFKRCGCSHELLLSAPSGCAAILIEGYTIHALTFLPGKQTTNNKGKLENIWARVRYLILDETSMLSAELLSQISERISNAKAVNTWN
jgi:hypothetical protein